ncbi:MAG TPA: ribonuclease J [Candidatus Dormibacteraeota bacterium]|nr:ribonuclease J [Candidatus Dormibacteraeota bacterium]
MSNTSNDSSRASASATRELVIAAPPDEPYVRVVPLGGCGEIGRNMTVIETNDDLVVVDCGLMFPDEEMYGVDIVISDFSYVRERADKLRALLVTHGHEDHIGGIPYFAKEFVRIPVIGTALSIALIKAKSREHKLGDVDFRTVVPGERVRFGSIEAEFIHVNHSVAGACALALRTPAGIVFHTGDFKFDQTPIDGRPADFSRIARVGEEGVLCMLSDSTNAERPGHTLSERIVGEAFAAIFARAKGRIIVASFASNVPRIQQVIDQAERFGRKIVFLGRSLQNVVHFATELGHLRIPPGTAMKAEQLEELPPEQIVVMTTGSQGEPMSGLTRMSVRDHNRLRIVSGDTVVVSATPIPGNEKSVYRTINNLYKLGATVVHGTDGRSHVSGHASQEELLLMLNLVRPEFFVPIHGEYRMLVQHGKLAVRTGVEAGNVFVAEDGDVLEFTLEYGDKVGKAYGGNVLVDGSGIGDIGEAVLRDRRALAGDGIVLVVVAIDAEEARVTAGPDVVARGVFYLPEADGVLEELRTELRASLDAISVEGMRDPGTVKEHLRDTLSKAIYSRTKRRPVVIPLVMEV